MKLSRSNKIFVFILFVLLLNTGAGLNGSYDERVIVMCRPSVSQIKNIEHMYEKDIITIKRLRLLCVYHEDERTNYAPSIKYVKEDDLSWVEFVTIKGMVDPGNLFKENKWTPQFKKIFDRSHGIIFTGGADIPPTIYGEETHLLSAVSTPIRSLYESSLMFHLIEGSQNPDFVPLLDSRKKYPVLGLCLGAQILNIAAGGSLYQDIPTEIYGINTMEQVLKLGQDKIHSSLYLKSLNPHEKKLPPAFHMIKFGKSSIFLKRMQMKRSENPYVLTSHHQAVEKLGKNLIVSATSMDGKVVEAIEHKKYKNVLGVQFHPEFYKLYLKKKYYRKEPGGKLDFNLKTFLEKNPPSMKFHKNLWRWFSESLEID